MSEKVYHTMGKVGVGNLVLGIVLIVSGITAGVLMIVNGSKLLNKKKDVFF